MAKQFIRRITPDHETIRNHKHLQIFGELLHDANLWHLNRRSAAGAFAVGLFMAFVPVPMQMVFSAGLAILIRVNLPLSVALVWITNPITIPPIFYGCYLIGTWVLRQPPQDFDFSLSGEALWHSVELIWEPLLLGCLLCSTLSAIIGYFSVQWLWRWHILQQLKKRRARAQSRAQAATGRPSQA